jgi:tripartite-type tricarboxylate transporter receptor subunit TctC
MSLRHCCEQHRSIGTYTRTKYMTKHLEPVDNPTRRRLLSAAFTACLAGAGVSSCSPAGEYPNRLVTFIIPFPPGGLGDAACRRLTQRLSEIWKVPVPVDNRPGATGLLGAGFVARAPADGYTVMYTIPETLSIAKAARQATTFDPVDDFRPISLAVLSSVLLMVPAASPHKTFKEFIDYAKENPGKLNFGIQGAGSTFHLALEALKAAAAADIVAVAYKGAAPALTDLLSGQLDALMISTSASLPYVRSRELRALAVASKDRVPQAPDLPAISEIYPGYDFPVSIAVFARKGTPEAIIEKLSTDISKVMHEPDMAVWLDAVASKTSDVTPGEFEAQIANDVKLYKQLIDRAGIKLE